jgi:hypothetical protein
MRSTRGPNQGDEMSAAKQPAVLATVDVDSWSSNGAKVFVIDSIPARRLREELPPPEITPMPEYGYASLIAQFSARQQFEQYIHARTLRSKLNKGKRSQSQRTRSRKRKTR